jgi:glyoxylase-like metal-dependent hydrolase (beta-lactamase superfamily II)
MLRKFVFLLLCGMACRPAFADKAPSYFTLHDLGHGVWAAVAVPKSGAGSNAGFVIGPDGVLVVDTFEDPAAASALLAAIRKLTPLPVRYVVNTHYHLDHVSGNNVFAKAGATILAQRNVRTWERVENLKFFGDRITPQQREMMASLALPTLTYKNDVTVYLGDREVDVRVMRGHTGGDSAVIVPDANVVFTGDLFWNHTLPNLIDATTQDQIASNDTFLREYPQARFVPGHGEVGQASDVRDFRDYLAALRDAVARSVADGKSGDALAAAVLPELKQHYGSWGWFDHFAPRNIAQTAAELSGSKRVPAPDMP